MTFTRHVAAGGIVVLVALGRVALPALAQVRSTTADLSGVVFDPTKAVLAGATVTATNAATGLQRRATAGTDGRYTIPALPPGVYTVTAALAGFGTKLLENVTLALGEAAIEDFILDIAATAEAVTVVAESTSGEARQGAIATVVSERQIDMLPTNGRNFIAFSAITPGANIDRTPQQGASASSGVTFLGQRGRSNNITVDGVDNNDSIAGGVRATFSQEAVQEFQVLSSSYSAEFGKASGGVVNIVTKSGTNTTSGNVFAYFRDDALNAKEHFERFDVDGTRLDRPKAPYAQRQFGGTLGGPLRRNHSFFFVSAERLRIRANNFVNIPIDALEVLTELRMPVEVGQVPYRYVSDQVLAKVDTHMKPNHHLTVRFNWADLLDENAEPWGGYVARSRGASMESDDLMVAASLTSVLSSRTVNELRFQVANRKQNLISLDPTCEGPCDGMAEGGPAVLINGIQVGRQIFTPQARENRRFQVVDTFSHVIGRHELKFGGDLSYVQQPFLAWPYAFGGQYIFADMDALARGRPKSYIQGYGNSTTSRNWFSDVSVFAQDGWAVSDRVLLQFGLRYQKQVFQQITETVPYLPPYGWPADNNDLAPRIGVSWAPLRSRSTFVKGSYGIFYDNHPGVIWGAPYMLNGTRERILTAPSPIAIVAWNSSGRRLPEPQEAYPVSITTIDPDLKTPFAHHASVGVTCTFRAGVTGSAQAVYVRGFDQVGSLEYNPVVHNLRKFPNWGRITQFTSWAESWYRGLILSLQKRLGTRSQFLAVYTLSKAEDTANDYAFSAPQDSGAGPNTADPSGLPLDFDPKSERGPSLQDQRHRFVLSGVYLLPRGITASGIVMLGSGRPYNITAGSDLNGDTVFTDRPERVPEDLETRIGRNAGLLPGTSSVDVRLAKRLTVRGGTLDLMLEMFNLLNHTNYTAVDPVFGTGAYPADPDPRGSFGRFTKAGPPFQAQLAVKVLF